MALLLCVGVAVGQDAALKAAVVKCVEEDLEGACECAGTSCSADARFEGPIGTWDVSGVKDMSSASAALAAPLRAHRQANQSTDRFLKATNFNRDLSAWDTSRVAYFANTSALPCSASTSFCVLMRP